MFLSLVPLTHKGLENNFVLGVALRNNPFPKPRGKRLELEILRSAGSVILLGWDVSGQLRLEQLAVWAMEKGQCAEFVR